MKDEPASACCVGVVSASITKYVPIIGSEIAVSIGLGAMMLAGDTHVKDCYRTARALRSPDSA